LLIPKCLSKKFHQRSVSTLNRLKNMPRRPSRKPYTANPEILVVLSIGLSEPVSVAIVNCRTGHALTYRIPQTSLGEQYRLLHRHRQQQRRNTLESHKNQTRGMTYQPSESELGEYVDRLLAKAIIELAQEHEAASIMIPNLTNLRELLASEINAKAEQAFPGSVRAQNRHTKTYRQTIHRWSYRRLIKAIRGKAEQSGIPVESEFQLEGMNSKEQALDVPFWGIRQIYKPIALPSCSV